MSAPGQYEGLQNRIRELQQQASDLDERRQLQILHQRGSMERLMEAAGVSDAAVAAHEIARLCEQLAIQDAKLAAARRYAEGLGAGGRSEWVGASQDLLRILGSQ